MDRSGPRTLSAYAGPELEAAMARPGQPTTEKAKLGPGAVATVYMWATLDSSGALPNAIRQRLSVKVGTIRKR